MVHEYLDGDWIVILCRSHPVFTATSRHLVSVSLQNWYLLPTLLSSITWAMLMEFKTPASYLALNFFTGSPNSALCLSSAKIWSFGLREHLSGKPFVTTAVRSRGGFSGAKWALSLWTSWLRHPAPHTVPAPMPCPYENCSSAQARSHGEGALTCWTPAVGSVLLCDRSPTGAVHGILGKWGSNKLL